MASRPLPSVVPLYTDLPCGVYTVTLAPPTGLPPDSEVTHTRPDAGPALIITPRSVTLASTRLAVRVRHGSSGSGTISDEWTSARYTPRVPGLPPQVAARSTLSRCHLLRAPITPIG